MSFDPGASQARYLPQLSQTTTVAITPSGASAWVVLNALSFPRWFCFVTTAPCYVVQGASSMTAPDATDFYMLSGERYFLIQPGWGIRILGDGTGFLCCAPVGV